MERLRILILVKTYPVLSSVYGELVCTAGLTEEGRWIRLYPIPFRLINRDKQFTKYQWIEVDIEKSTKDIHPESYKIVNVDTIRTLEFIKPNFGWAVRKEILFRSCKIYTSMTELIASANTLNTLSLALFKPQCIRNFIVEKSEREWDMVKLKQCEDDIHRPTLFDNDEDREIKETSRIVKKIPYKFSYHFIDSENSTRTLMIED